MRVFIKNITTEETLILVNIENTADVNRIKETIQDIKGIPVHHQRLFFEGKEMADDGKLSLYNVVHNNMINLTVEIPVDYSNGVAISNTKSLAKHYVENKKICRKCYGRLPPNATRCRKAKCGRTHNIRWKKPFYKFERPPNKYPKELRL